LFVTQRAPITGLGSGCAIVKTVTRALNRAGIVSERKGGYLFRQTLATEMLGRGASLREIGEVLRHRKADTTRINAKWILLRCATSLSRGQEERDERSAKRSVAAYQSSPGSWI
jgi:hypothetical protein